jgi:hypothetical protein
LGVVYVECKKCFKKKCECHHRCRPFPPANNAVRGAMESRRHHGCGCRVGASRFYKYAD